MSKYRASHPEWYWIASRTDLPWLADPDEEDGRIRWPDPVNWAAVATVVAQAGVALTNANCDPDDVVELSLDDSELSDGERAIVRSWLSGLAGSPLADPWSDALTDGRHRLWSAWQADPNALLPIHSDLLPYELDAPSMGQAFTTQIAMSARDGLSSTSQRILSRSPLYARELRRLGASAL